MILRDGGVLIIPNETIEKWVDLYPYTYVQEEINKLNDQNKFEKLSKKGALKLINQTLKEKNELNKKRLESRKNGGK